MVLLFILLLWSRFCHLLIVSRFLSLGLVSCLVLKPFKPRPLFGFCMCPSFLCLVCFVAAVFSLVFSFSQALGKPKPPSGGLGFPLCSLLAAHALRPRPVLQGPHLHQGVAPHLPFFVFVFFFSFVVAARFLVRCLLVLVMSVLVFLVGVLGLWFWSLPGSCIAR